MKKTAPHFSLTLPPLDTDGSTVIIDHDINKIVIVGANGAGKTRFAQHLATTTPHAYRISSLHALYDQRYRDDLPGSIDSQYRDLFDTPLIPHENHTTQAERLTALLLRHEMTILLHQKLEGKSAHHLKKTPLDGVIALWQEIFPNNKILVEAGRLLVKSRSQDDIYSTLRLSAGERAILYLIGAVIMSPKGAQLFIDSPEMFLHPSVTQSIWNRIELLRRDCRFIYVTHDLDFAGSRSGAPVVWVRNFDPANITWDYRLIPADTPISEEIYSTILGARKPVLFIEGDETHSIDGKLYPLIFKDYTVRSLGSCNKVIEATRTFNDLTSFHHMDSYGIVDRDRRDESEVAYLRRKKVMVPDVAEIENILMLEDVIKAVASYRGCNPAKVFQKVKQSVINQFKTDLRKQALQHTRHRVKRIMETRIDGRFRSIAQLEQHLRQLPDEINAQALYESFCRDFRIYILEDDYRSVLRVYNQKSMLPSSNVAGLCGLADKREYINTILHILSEEAPEAAKIRTAVKRCFGLQKQS